MITKNLVVGDPVNGGNNNNLSSIPPGQLLYVPPF